MSLEEMEVLYAVNMIGLKQFDREKHRQHCSVCRIDDVEECLREQGISRELFAKIQNRVILWKPCQVMVFPAASGFINLLSNLLGIRLLTST